VCCRNCWAMGGRAAAAVRSSMGSWLLTMVEGCCRTCEVASAKPKRVWSGPQPKAVWGVWKTVCDLRHSEGRCAGPALPCCRLGPHPAVWAADVCLSGRSMSITRPSPCQHLKCRSSVFGRSRALQLALSGCQVKALHPAGRASVARLLVSVWFVCGVCFL
jgi:hypothetical protein